jgi:hypothetical protein
MQSLIQILKTNEVRKGISAKTNKPWEMQDAECVLINQDGTPASVGVLQLPKSLMGASAPAPGIYTATFALVSGMTDRKINAVLTHLTPVGKTPAKAA